MASPAPSSTQTAPRKTLPLPTTSTSTRRATTNSLRPGTGGLAPPNTTNMELSGGSVQTTTISRTHNRDTPPEPSEIERALVEMIRELEELEEVLGGFFDGVINTTNPGTDLNQTKRDYDKAITKLTHLIQLSKSTSLGGVPLIQNPTTDTGPTTTSTSTSTSVAPPPTSPLNPSTIPSDASLPTPLTAAPPTLSALIQTIERASGESYSRIKVMRDEVRGVGEVLGR